MDDALRDSFLAQVDAVLAECAVPGNALPDDEYYQGRADAFIAKGATACAALIERLTPSDSQYRRRATSIIDGYGVANGYG